MENLIITGQITATSSKKDDKFKQENPTKMAYVTVTKKEDVEALEAFGATKYTTKEDNRDFFILKVPQSFVVVKGRSEERRVGKECRIKREPIHKKKRKHCKKKHKQLLLILR